MRQMRVRGLLVYCSDYKCSHWGNISADRWRDYVRLSDLEVLFVCSGLRREASRDQAGLRVEQTAAGERAAPAEHADRCHPTTLKMTAPARGKAEAVSFWQVLFAAPISAWP